MTADLTAAQRQMIAGLADQLDRAKVETGTIRDTLTGPSLTSATLAIVEAELRLLAGLCHAAAHVEQERTDLRVDWCPSCNRQMSVRLDRCVYCGTVVPSPRRSLAVVEGGGVA